MPDASDVEEIVGLLGRYSRMVDHRTVDRDGSSVFAPDARYSLRNGGVVEGLVKIIEFLGGTPPGTHVVGTPDVELDGRTAHSTAAFIYRSADDDLASGYYHDDLIRSEQGWRIVHRQVCAAGREDCEAR